MLNQNKINYLFISAILLVYLLTRIHDIYIIINVSSIIQPIDLSVTKFLAGIQWFNSQMLSIHVLYPLGKNGNHELFLDNISGYGNVLSTLLCLAWVIYLTIKSKNNIKSTQILLLGYMLFAFLGDFFAYRYALLTGDSSAYFTTNSVSLTGIFILAHSCEIIRELTYSNENLTLIKRHICLLLLVSISMILLGFQFNMPLIAYLVILMLHTYSAFTVNRRKIYQGRAASCIKIATVFYILLDTGTIVFYLNSDVMWIKVSAYLLDYFLYTIAHVLFICSEWQKSTNLKH